MIHCVSLSRPRRLVGEPFNHKSNFKQMHFMEFIKWLMKSKSGPFQISDLQWNHFFSLLLELQEQYMASEGRQLLPALCPVSLDWRAVWFPHAREPVYSPLWGFPPTAVVRTEPAVPRGFYDFLWQPKKKIMW